MSGLLSVKKRCKHLTIKLFLAKILSPLFRPVQRYWKTTGQDGNIAAHLPLLGAAGIWREVLQYLNNNLKRFYLLIEDTKFY